MRFLQARLFRKISQWCEWFRWRQDFTIEVRRHFCEIKETQRKLEYQSFQRDDALHQLQRQQNTIIQRLRRNARLPLTLALQELHRNLDEYKKEFFSLPDESSPIWTQLCDLHENYIRMNWLDRGRAINLNNPRTLAEKLEWLKLNDHREVLIEISDKFAVREYVRRKTNSASLLNRLYGVYQNADDIPIDEMPEKFVVKANHWSGGNFICASGDAFDTSERARLTSLLSSVYAVESVEWPYWKIEPRLFVEEYLEDQFSELVDYKIFCFNGIPKLILVCIGRFAPTNVQILYFDTEWNLQPIKGSAIYDSIPAGKDFPRPESLNEMLQYASLLSQDAAFVRVDLYDVFGQCRFGELTLYPDSGLGCVVSPEEWNYVLGDWLQLPKANRKPWVAYC